LAPTGRAKCRKCKKIINIEEPRLSKSTLYTTKNKYIKQHHHPVCLFESFRNARVATNIIMCPEDIEGLDRLDDVAQEEIRNLITILRRTDLPLTTNKEKEIFNSVNNQMIASTNLDLQSLTIMFTNADTLTLNKMTELKARINEIKPHIIAVSECKPKNFKERAEGDYILDNYTAHLCNLTPDHERGIIIYTHQALDKSIARIEPVVVFSEVTLLEIKLSRGDKLLFGCVYRSPTSSAVNNKHLGDLICSISLSYSHVCLVGDFNLGSINWALHSAHDSSRVSHQEDNLEEPAGQCAESVFLRAVHDSFLYQHVESDTRARGSSNPSLLDLV